MTDQATFGIAIVANDKTTTGRRKAEKGFSDTAKRVGEFGRKAADANDKAIRRSTSGMVGSFTSAERAASKLFGGRSITGGLTGKIGMLSQVTASLGESMGAAAAEGGTLGGVIGGVGAVAAGTVGILAAATIGALKLADGWAKSAVSLGNTAQIIGVGTKTLQEFTAAAERAGIDKGAAAGALGGLSSTLNDARYARNPAALSAMAKAGIQMKLNGDGTVNVDAMLPQIADAFKRQNSSGARTLARYLGMSESVIPLLTKGGSALTGEMNDAGQTAPMFTDDDVRLGQKMTHRHVKAMQGLDRNTVFSAQRAIAEGVYAAENKVIEAFSGSVTDHFAPAARTIERAANKMERAADRIGTGAGSGGSVIRGHAVAVDAIRKAAAATGVDPNMMLSIAHHESGLIPDRQAPKSSARGLFQFINDTWFGYMKKYGAKHGYGWAADAIGKTRRGHWGVADPMMRARILGLRDDPYLNALMGGEMARENDVGLTPILGHHPGAGESYMANFLGIAGAQRFFKLRAANPNAPAADLFPDAAGSNRPVFYTNGGKGRERSLEEVYTLMAGFAERPIKVEVSVSGLPAGAKARVGAAHGKQPTIQHSFSEITYQPVHGG